MAEATPDGHCFEESSLMKTAATQITNSKDLSAILWRRREVSERERGIELAPGEEATHQQ